MQSATATSQDNNGDNGNDGTASDTEAAILRSRILIVDDQLAHVHLLGRLLHDTGYLNVSSTLDARQVGALHRQHGYDLILLDLQMPGLDGFGVMDELKADMADGGVPVIVFTAQPVHRLRALQAGARDFINKPFDTLEVRIRIHHMLELRVLHQALQAHARDLERTVQERTAELQESEARYRSLTELAVDLYWEQSDDGTFTKVSGAVMQLLGITDPTVAAAGDSGGSGGSGTQDDVDLWDDAERRALQDNITARRPFLDFVMHCRRADGSRRQFRVSGQPMFDRHCRYIGYQGLGVEDLAFR